MIRKQKITEERFLAKSDLSPLPLQKMKKLLFMFVAVLTLLTITGFFAFRWWGENMKAVSALSTQQRFVIPKGSSAESIAAKLKKEGLVKSPLAFKMFVQINGQAGKIQAGEFNLSPSMTLPKIVEKLLSGPDELWVSIPEGLRREEVAERFITSLELQGKEATDFRREFLQASIGKEGMLFPDSYLFPRDIAADKAVDRLNQTFDAKLKEVGNNLPAGFNFQQIVILASLIEREAITNEERPVIAGILYNRMENGWALQIDAAVQYAVGSEICKIQIGKCDDWWPKSLTRDDLEIDSPYNTYKYPGLPPAPIANPGLGSLTAAANPADTDYMFYLHGTDGVIRYAKTNQEHNDNIRNYLNR
jgi:UPF0755 protein